MVSLLDLTMILIASHRTGGDDFIVLILRTWYNRVKLIDITDKTI